MIKTKTLTIKEAKAFQNACSNILTVKVFQLIRPASVTRGSLSAKEDSACCKYLDIIHGRPDTFLVKDVLAGKVEGLQYELVAIFEIEDSNKVLDHAFEMTNSIDSPWYENPAIRYVGRIGGCRSTSVGDVIVVERTNVETANLVSGTVLVSAIGFTEIASQKE